MFRSMTFFILVAAGASAASAQGISVQFRDGAPKDSITLTNMGCSLKDATIVIDLNGSAGGLIFDVTGEGAGVEVFQPVEVTNGTIAVSPIVDGGQVLHMQVAEFPNGSTLSLTADLDDTLEGRQITVSGAEMAGGTVTLVIDGLMENAPFNGNGIALLQVPPTAEGCLNT